MQFVIESLSHVPSPHMVNSREIRLLTPREVQVVALVGDGLSNREVARKIPVCLLFRGGQALAPATHSTWRKPS
jgi:hypothetical protein